MVARKETTTITMKQDREEHFEERIGQKQKPDTGQFRLQVDRQTKRSRPSSNSQSRGHKIASAPNSIRVQMATNARLLHHALDQRDQSTSTVPPQPRTQTKRVRARWRVRCDFGCDRTYDHNRRLAKSPL